MIIKMILGLLLAVGWIILKFLFSCIPLFLLICGVGLLFNLVFDDTDSDSPISRGGYTSNIPNSSKSINSEEAWDSLVEAFTSKDSINRQPHWSSPGDGFFDGNNIWRHPGDSYFDWKHIWRTPDECYFDPQGYWRQPGDGFFDVTGTWRNPGEGFFN